MSAELQLDKSDWKPVTFGDVVSEVRKSTKDPVADGIERVVGLEHIEPECIHLRNWASINDETTFTKTFGKGHVLFGRRRAYLKKAAQAEFKGICSGDITVMEAKNDLLPELLPFLVCNDKFFDYAVQHSAGGLSPRTKFKDLANFAFCLPPKDQQAKLRDILWAADRELEKRKTLSAKIHDSINPIVLGEIAKFSPKPSSLRELISSSHLNLLTGPFGTVLSAKSYSDVGTPVINPTHISKGKISTTRGPYVPGPVFTRLEKYHTAPGDILLGRKGEVGRSALVKSSHGNLLVGSDCMRLRVLTEDVLPEYLNMLFGLDSAQRWFERYSYGTTMPGIDEMTLGKFPIPLIDIQEQEMVVREYTKFLELSDDGSSAIRATTTLTKSLINQIF